jgi:hypothetical protein
MDMRGLAILALILAMVLPDVPAHATILFASGEDSGFTAIGGTIVISGTAGRFRAGYPRVVIATPANAGTTDPPTNRMQTATFTAGNLVWVHAQLWDVSSTAVANQQGIIVRSPDGVSRILVRQTATAGTLKISTRNAAGTITDLATASTGFATSTVTQIDVKIDYSAAGGVQMWLGSTQVINFAGDPRTDAATTLNQVEIGNLTNGTTNWSEIIVADQDTRAMGLVTLQPSNPGNTQGWTGGTVTAINENPLNDASFLSDGTGNVLSQWTTPAALPGGAGQILAIVQEARLRKGGTGPSAFDWSLRVSGIDYLAGTTTALTTSFLNYANQQWLTNPGTGTGWALTDITGGTLNLGVKSLP